MWGRKRGRNMKMEIKRVVKKEVEETVEVELKKYWVVRIIHGANSKTCVDEKEFDYIPNEQEIAEVLFPYYGRPCFATVNENYKFVNV